MSEDERKRREREQERREQEDREDAQKQAKAGVPQSKAGRRSEPEPALDVNTLAAKIDPLVDQLNQMYRMYLQGQEKNPPKEKRALLDSWVAQLQEANKGGIVGTFRISALLQKVRTFQEKWDRELRERERT